MNAKGNEQTFVIHTQIDKPYSGQADETWLCRAASKTLHLAEAPSSELTIVVTDDEKIRSLNKMYRGIDRPTDVLSFGGETDGFVLGPEDNVYLGDVVISLPRAQTQASAAGHSVESELALLVVHGVLHLLGHDHASPEDKRVMWAHQADTLSALDLNVVLPETDSPHPEEPQ